MKLLVLGGTAWLGRTLALEALGRGHSVTCLARGDSGDVLPGVRFVRADRSSSSSDVAYAQVVGEHWDVVIDVATQPGHVRGAVAELHAVVGQYIFVSSGSVYASQRKLNQDESAPIQEPLESDVMESMADYGRAKVACESAVTSVFGSERSLVARVGLIGGPGDTSGRSGYWPWRFSRPSNSSGTVLVPDAPDLPAALIDVRDLAEWLITCAERGTVGVFNATANQLPFTDHLATARSVAGRRGDTVAASSAWLVDQGVQNWAGPRSLPLWLSDRDWFGLSAHDVSRARGAGLVSRPLEQTLADTLEWELDRAQPGPHGAGLTDEEERSLLAQLATAR